MNILTRFKNNSLVDRRKYEQYNKFYAPTEFKETMGAIHNPKGYRQSFMYNRGELSILLMGRFETQAITIYNEDMK